MLSREPLESPSELHFNQLKSDGYHKTSLIHEARI